MDVQENYQQIAQSPTKKLIVSRMHQPLTAAQLAPRIGYHRDVCSYLLTELALANVVACLNSLARSNRLYWLTDLGRACQSQFHRDDGRPALSHDFPRVDWRLYGTVIHRHRAAVIKALNGTLKPSAIRKRAKMNDPSLRMSGGNCRDVVRSLADLGVVRRIEVPREIFYSYELTPVGRDLQTLLIRARGPA